jgi:DNA-binding NarL/FixJ family response regulator
MVVDDHAVVRDGLVRLIDDETDFAVVGTAATADEALAVCASCQPDIAVVDIALPGRGGVDLIGDLTERWPDTRVLVLSMYPEREYAPRCLRAGARGYVVKEDTADTLLAALRDVRDRGFHASSAVSDALVQGLAAGKTGLPDVGWLTDRELEVFRQIGAGRSTRQIADALELSVKTVETYRSRIKKKLALESGVELVRRAVLWVEREGTGGRRIGGQADWRTDL